MDFRKIVKSSACVLSSCLLVFFLHNSLFAEHKSTWHAVNVSINGNVGDAHVIINDDVITMIDAGEYQIAKTTLLPYLKEIGIRSIDHFFISHPHNDHYKGLNALLESDINIRNIYYNMPPAGVSDFAYNPSEFLTTLENAADQGTKLKNIKKGFRVNYHNNSEIKVLYAHKERKLNGEYLSVNDYSLIIRWDAFGFRVLFTGDLNYPLGRYLSDYDYFKADILKVPHHGVTGVAPDAFFNTVAPSLNVFPTPQFLWSHPRINQVKTWTLNKEIMYCVNGLNGNIVLNFDESKLSLLPEVSSLFCPTGIVEFTPGEHINEPTALPYLLPILNNK